MTTDLFHKSDIAKLIDAGHLNPEELYTTSVPRFQKKTIQSSHFFINFNAAALLGLPYTTQSIKLKSYRLPLPLKAWCLLMTVAKLVTLLLFLATGIIYMPAKMTVFTFYTLGTVAFYMTFYLSKHHKKISSAIRKVCQMSQQIAPLQIIGSKTCRFQLILLALVLVYFSYILKVGVYSLQYKAFKVFGVDLRSAYRISVILVYLNGTAVCGLSIVTCGNVFATLRTVLTALRARMKDRYRLGRSSRATVLEDLVVFRKVAESYRSLEECVAPLILCSIVLCSVSFLNSLSILLTRKLEATPMVGIFSTFLQALVPFLYLTSSATAVTKEGLALKQSLLRCSEDIASARSSRVDIPFFAVLCDNVRAVDFVFTAADMFVVDKGLLLTVGGAMVTYGVIEYQLSHV